jgi:hypothetical protein
MSLRATEQDRADVAAARVEWHRGQRRLDPARLIFLDETWTKTNMTRSVGRATRGQRVGDAVPYGRRQTSTFLAGLRRDRVVARCVFNGAINGTLFLAYVAQMLVPVLTPGDIVIMDNLRSHTVAGVREAIEAAGATVWLLPAYSPDLNPIEQVFATARTPPAQEPAAQRAATSSPPHRMVIRLVRHHVGRRRHAVRQVEQRHCLGEIENRRFIEANGAQIVAVCILDQPRRRGQLPCKVQHRSLSRIELRHAIVQCHHLAQFGVAR